MVLRNKVQRWRYAVYDILFQKTILFEIMDSWRELSVQVSALQIMLLQCVRYITSIHDETSISNLGTRHYGSLENQESQLNSKSMMRRRRVDKQGLRSPSARPAIKNPIEKTRRERGKYGQQQEVSFALFCCIDHYLDW